MNTARDASPLVTIGVFGYNHERFIGEAVASVRLSSFQDWELVVVDDGSQDATADALRTAYTDDPRIAVINDRVNLGLANRLNQVLASARGEWLAVLGGDDAFLPEGLELLVGAIADDVDVIWGDLQVMDVHGRSMGYSRPRDTWQGGYARRYIQAGRPGEDLLRRNNFVSGTSPLIRVRALREVGGYTSGTRNEDLDLWLRLGTTHSFRYVNAEVARYRVVSGSSSRSERLAVLDQAEIVRRELQAGRYAREDLANLLAMRWCLAWARGRGRAEVSLRAASHVSGLATWELLRATPRASATPLIGSAVAFLRRRRSVSRPGRSGSDDRRRPAPGERPLRSRWLRRGPHGWKTSAREGAE